MADEFSLDIGGDIEPGTYLCTLIGLEKFQIISNGEYETPAGEAIDKLRWTFATDDGLATGPRSKMRAWMTGIGVDISRPQKLRLDDLVGRSAMVTVALNENGYAGISSVVPAPKARAK